MNQAVQNKGPARRALQVIAALVVAGAALAAGSPDLSSDHPARCACGARTQIFGSQNYDVQVQGAAELVLYDPSRNLGTGQGRWLHRGRICSCGRR